MSKVDDKEQQGNALIKDGKLVLNEFHTKEYLKLIKNKYSKDKPVIFVLPNGKEVKYE